MKKILALCAALALSVVMVLPVAATTGKGSATQFTAAYANGTTTWTCSGVNVANKNVIKDNETCVISGDLTGYVAGTYTGSPYGYFPTLGTSQWNSDYNGALATSWTITLVDDLNGTFTANIAAIYP